MTSTTQHTTPDKSRVVEFLAPDGTKVSRTFSSARMAQLAIFVRDTLKTKEAA